MASTAEQVARILSRDAVVREGLRRGIINTRALARWMISTQGWPASEEAVLSALRRSPWAKPPPETTAALRRILQSSHIDTTSDVCSVMLHGGLADPRVRSVLARLVKGEPRPFVRVVASEGSARLVVHRDDLPELKRIVPADAIDDLRKGLAEISIRQTKESLGLPGVVASIVGALSFQGINFLGIVRHKDALQFLVDEQDASRALAALTGLVGHAPPATGARSGQGSS